MEPQKNCLVAYIRVEKNKLHNSSLDKQGVNFSCTCNEKLPIRVEFLTRDRRVVLISLVWTS